MNLMIWINKFRKTRILLQKKTEFFEEFLRLNLNLKQIIKYGNFIMRQE